MMIQTGKPVSDEIHSQIEDRDFLTTIVPLGEDNIIITSTDITERKKAERERLDAIQRYENLASRINVGIYLLRSTPEGRFSFDYVSPKMAELFDVEVGALLNDAYILFGSIHPDDLDDLVELNEQKTRLKQPFEWEGRVMSHDKTHQMVKARIFPRTLRRW